MLCMDLHWTVPDVRLNRREEQNESEGQHTRGELVVSGSNLGLEGQARSDNKLYKAPQWSL